MRKRIFHHPVGIFPAGARWYLASIAVLSLLCVAMQLSIQIHAQQKAEKLIARWGKAAGVQVDYVHYHLLRNALILRQIKVVRGEDFIAMEHMLLRANPTLLTGRQPQIGRVEISGFEAALSLAGIEESWRQDEALRRLWQATRSLHLKGGNINLYPQGEAHPPLIFTDVSLDQQLQGTAGILTASARLGGAPVHWQWQTDKAEGLARGKLGWRDIDAGLLAASLGLRPVDGTVKGRLDWSPASDSRAALIEGSMELDAGHKASGHLLQWRGSKSAGLWQLDISARAWPLDGWAASLPKIGNRSLLSARLDANLLISGQPGAWKISSRQGDLHDVVYQAGENMDTPAWHWERLSYEHLRLEPARQRLQASNILMATADIAMQAQQLPSPGQIGAEEQPGREWSIDVANIRAEQLQLGLHLERGSVNMEGLQGSGSWSADGALDFELSSAADIQADQSTGEEEPFAAASWQLQGQLRKQTDRSTRAALRLSARQVPLTRLRALIPLAGSKSKPLTLGGKAALELDIQVDKGVWQAHGSATAGNIHLSHGGDILEIEKLSMKLGPVGMGLPVQKLESLDIEGWHYTTALNPLPPLSATATATATAAGNVKPEPTGQLWWARNLSRQNWQIGTTAWLDGSISLGREEARWAEQVNLRLDHIRTDRLADISMQGKLGGGELSLTGSWDALGKFNRFRGDASLHDAMPFFLRTWMNISGMPQPIRGRLSAKLSVADAETGDGYVASAQIRLLRGLTRLGVFPDDPLISRIGYNTKDTLMLLANARGNAELAFEIEGEWHNNPLTEQRLGQALQSALQKKIRQQEELDHTAMHEPGSGEMLAETHIRLHDSGSLSLNERIRLHKLLRILRADPDTVIDLVPNWAGQKLNPKLLARIQHSQQLVERYIAYRKIARERIFPLWPTTENQVKGIGSISVIVRRQQSLPESTGDDARQAGRLFAGSTALHKGQHGHRPWPPATVR